MFLGHKFMLVLSKKKERKKERNVDKQASPLTNMSWPV